MSVCYSKHSNVRTIPCTLKCMYNGLNVIVHILSYDGLNVLENYVCVKESNCVAFKQGLEKLECSPPHYPLFDHFSNY